MAGHGEKLARKQEQAVAALLESATIGAAAAKVGVCERTLKNWLALPAFRGAYRSARQEVLDRTVVQLLGACGEAVETLRSSLTSQRRADRIRAAVAILAHAVKGVETLDLAERVKALEERQ